MKPIKRYIVRIIFSGLIALNITGCIDSSSSSDLLPPSVSLYTPATNDTIIYGKREIIYDAYDDQGIAKVDLYVNNTYVSSFSTESGQTRPKVEWDVSSTLVGTKVSYYIIVYDLGGNGVKSEVKSNIVVLLTKDPPNVPYAIAVRKLTDNLINLSWKDTSKLVDGYEIYRAIGTADPAAFELFQVVGANIRNINDATISSDLIYYYKIRGFNSIGKSSFSTVINSLGSTGTSGLLPPSNLTGTAYGTKEVYLTWKNNTTNENYFIVERRQSSGSSFSSVGTKGPGATNHTDTSPGLYGDADFVYRIKVFTSSDSAVSQEVTVRTMPFDLNAPSNLTASIVDTPSVAQKLVRLTWNDNSNQETQNIVEIQEQGSSTWSELVTLPQDTKTYDHVPSLRGRTYTYRVRNSNQGYYSKYSNTVSIFFP